MNLFLLAAIGCGIYGAFTKQKEFILFGLFLLVIQILPMLTVLLSLRLPFNFSPLHLRLINMILFMGIVSIFMKKIR